MRSAFPRSAPLLVAGCALALLAGCSSSAPVASTSFVAQADSTSVMTDGTGTRPVRGGDVSGAVAFMPEPGGSPVTIREKFFANGMKQDIVLAGDRSPFGDNVLSVAIQSAPAAGARGVPVFLPSEAGIKSEIVQRYPHVDMQILTQPRRNALGTFGLAIGRHASGVRCVYAWQYVEDVRNPGVSSSTLGKIGSFGSSTQPASIRVNMCRKDATVDDLAMAVEGLSLASSAILDRALDGSRTSTAVATRPASGGGVAVAAAEGTLEGALTTVVRPGRQVASSAGSDAPERRRVARRERKPAPAPDESVQPQTIAPAAPVYSTGPRYLAPVAGTPSGAGYAGAPAANATSAYNVPAYGSAPAYGGSMPTSGKTLDPSLPAAAYRGPSGRTQ